MTIHIERRTLPWLILLILVFVLARNMTQASTESGREGAKVKQKAVKPTRHTPKPFSTPFEGRSYRSLDDLKVERQMAHRKRAEELGIDWRQRIEDLRNRGTREIRYVEDTDQES